MWYKSELIEFGELDGKTLRVDVVDEEAIKLTDESGTIYLVPRDITLRRLTPKPPQP
jgi:hypothetical protein